MVHTAHTPETFVTNPSSRTEFQLLQKRIPRTLSPLASLIISALRPHSSGIAQSQEPLSTLWFAVSNIGMHRRPHHARERNAPGRGNAAAFTSKSGTNNARTTRGQLRVC
jgi:hypothetical protein